ncbi:MAG: Fe-S protein assembly co-chaperone HscB [Bacteroidota bacterium]|nr:Fe-S protein assembly co-chaperone HscB [Bacteroidota bacterium]
MMNYFELFEIPVSLKPDGGLVKKKYYELSRKYHPDFFSQSSDEEQADALEKSAQVNKAYKVFSNADETIKYVLQLKGLLQEEEKYQLSPDFLMEMMELNEQLMDAKMEGDTEVIAKIQSSINNIQSSLYELVKNIVEHYQEGVTSEKELLQVKDYYFKKKYLSRLTEGMDKQ